MAGAANVIPMTIRPGTAGEPVLRLQQALAGAGFETPVDGVFGVETEGCLRTFQQSRGLPMSGMADHATQAELGLTDDALPAAGVPFVASDLAARVAEAARTSSPSARLQSSVDDSGDGMVAEARPQRPGTALAQVQPESKSNLPLIIVGVVVVGIPIVLWLVDRMSAKPAFEDFEDPDGLDDEIAAPEQPRKKRKSRAKKPKAEPKPEKKPKAEPKAEKKPKKSKAKKKPKKIEEPPEEIEEELEDELPDEPPDEDEEEES